MKEITKLADGFAYCEVRSVYNTTVDMKPMVDKNGSPMILITWDVVDRNGDTGVIRAYVSSKVKSLLSNLENALDIDNPIFDERINQFNCSLIKNRCCAAVIKFNDKYGSQVEKYVPMEFFKYLNHKESDQKKSTNQSDSSRKYANHIGINKSETQRLMEEKGASFDESGNLDDIPF